MLQGRAHGIPSRRSSGIVTLLQLSGQACWRLARDGNGFSREKGLAVERAMRLVNATTAVC